MMIITTVVATCVCGFMACLIVKNNSNSKVTNNDINEGCSRNCLSHCTNNDDIIEGCNRKGLSPWYINNNSNSTSDDDIIEVKGASGKGLSLNTNSLSPPKNYCFAEVPYGYCIVFAEITCGYSLIVCFLQKKKTIVCFC